jgi:uracil-DNA glycosylase
MSTTETIDIEQVRLKLYENLKPSGWGDKLKTFLLSSDFEKILLTLLDEVKAGKRFTPPLKLVFKAFECCDMSKLKVVMIGQDPYPQPYVASGIAFSCDVTGKPEKSLKYIFKALEETVYPEGYLWDPDLSRWGKQGVLMLNSALTTQMSKTGTHYTLWKPFLEFLFDYLNINHPGLVYVFMGKKAQELEGYIEDNSFKLACSHPASAAYKDLERWDCNDIFNKTNEILSNQYNEQIIW